MPVTPRCLRELRLRGLALLVSRGDLRFDEGSERDVGGEPESDRKRCNLDADQPRPIGKRQRLEGGDRGFYRLSREEGIMPALESAHAVAHAIRIAPCLGPEQVVLVNLSGRGDKDVMSVQKKLARAVDGDEKAGTR